jgi:carbonic anhydrase/acetyltransferase-like protein (isoleucine patch superfamily)
MLVTRNGKAPRLDGRASVAPSATIVGDVRIGAGAYIDHGTVVASGGPPIEIGEETVVLAGTIVRSVGGASRPAFPVEIGPRTLVSPGCVLTGCRVGSNCYLATGVTVLQGARLGDHVRVGVDAIVHATTALPDLARIGMRHVAVPTPDGYLTTADVEEAREVIAGIEFFDLTFGAGGREQADLHRLAIGTLLDEVHSWRDEPAGGT